MNTYISITFDVENDFSTTSSKNLSWKGLDDGIPLILEQLRSIEDSFGNEMKFTWFVRADNQLKEIYGNAGYLLDRYSHLWKLLLKEGDEVGWHPHIYRRLNSGKWTLEKRDDHLKQKLVESYEAVTRRFSITSARMGECFHNNTTIALFESLGIKVDSTALPNRKRNDTERFFDWSCTPNHPYYPSKLDYRVPGKGEDQLNILEVPMTTIKIKTNYDEVPLDRYLNLGFHVHLMRDDIKKLVRKRDILVAVTHPYELVSIYPKKHPLISFDINNARNTILTILNECKKINKPFKFITISEILDLWMD